MRVSIHLGWCGGGTGEKCQHINAVLTSFGRSNGANGEDRYAAEDGLAIQGENGTAYRDAIELVEELAQEGILLLADEPIAEEGA